MFLSKTSCRKGWSRTSRLSLCTFAILALLMGLALPIALADGKKKGDDKKDHPKVEAKKNGDDKKGQAKAKPGSHKGKGKDATHHTERKKHKPGEHPGKVTGKAHLKRVGVKRHVSSIHITKRYRVLHLGRWHRPRWAHRVAGVVVGVAPRPYRVRVAL